MVKKYTHIFLPSICSYLHKVALFFWHIAIDIFYLAIFLLRHFIRFGSYLLQLVLPLFRSDMDGEIPVDPEEYLSVVIRGEIPYVPEDAGEEHGGEDGGQDGGQEEDVSSFLNLTGDGMEIVPANNNDEGQTNIDGQVYILSIW